MKDTNISHKCQEKRIMSVFFIMHVNRSISFCVISNTFAKTFQLKTQPVKLAFTNLFAYIQNDAWLKPLGDKDASNMIVCNSQNKHCMMHWWHKIPQKELRVILKRLISFDKIFTLQILCSFRRYKVWMLKVFKLKSIR